MLEDNANMTVGPSPGEGPHNPAGSSATPSPPSSVAGVTPAMPTSIEPAAGALDDPGLIPTSQKTIMASEQTILANRPDSAPNASARRPRGRRSISLKSLKALFSAGRKQSFRAAQRRQGEGTVPQADPPDLMMRAMMFLGGIFARVPGGERCDFIEAIRRQIAELEQTPIRGVDAERRLASPKSPMVRLLARLGQSSRPAQQREGEGTMPPAHEPDWIKRATTFLGRIFARLGDGERREFIGCIGDHLAELEQKLTRRVAAERRPVPPAPEQSLAPQRIDAGSAAMKKEDQDPPPNSTDPSAASTAKDPAAKPEVPLAELTAEYFRLARVDPNPARLWPLRKEILTRLLRQIDSELFLLEGKKHMVIRLEDNEDLTQPYKLAVCRPDLTIPELRCLDKWITKKNEESQKALVAQKQELEQELDPWKRRHRKAT